MARPLLDLFPRPQSLIEAAPEDVAGAIFELWQPVRGRRSQCRIEDFTEECFNRNRRDHYPEAMKEDIVLVVAEAWAWLEREGLIMPDPWDSSGTMFLQTRRGKQFKSRADAEAFRKASLLPRDLLHPAIEAKAWPLYQRGDYDVAVFQAFKSIEVAVRDAAGLHDLLGTKLMRRAFNPSDGALTELSVDEGERVGLMEMFAGAIGHAKNPQSHRDKPVSIEDAARLLMFASYLMSIVELQKMLR